MHAGAGGGRDQYVQLVHVDLDQILEEQTWRLKFQTLTSNMNFIIIVTVYEKTRHMGFFVKIKFDVYLISSTLELTYLQV